jgi:hypothetical protein
MEKASGGFGANLRAGEHFQERIAMLRRGFILAAVVFTGLILSSAPAIAEEPKAEPSRTTIDQKPDSTVPVTTNESRVRLSTRDRWRGRPYLRSSTDETVRSHALDKALPPANHAFSGGGSFNILSR